MTFYNKRTKELTSVLAMHAGRVLYDSEQFAQYSIDDEFEHLDIDHEAGLVTYDFVIRPYRPYEHAVAKKEDKLKEFLSNMPIYKKQLVISTAKLFELYSPIFEVDY